MTDRDAARELLRELLPELLGEVTRTNGNGNGNGRHPAPHSPGDVTPRVPAPPVAAILRPSTWTMTPEPGEIIGDATTSPSGAATGSDEVAPRDDHTGASSGRTEWVSLDSDEDLDRFVRALLGRFENPRDRMAIRAGHLRFALRRAATRDAHDGRGAGATMRIERGAVTERTVNEAAAAGARLVLAPAAVLTPLAREKARALHVDIEKERRC
jgi:hypothetical protein